MGRGYPHTANHTELVARFHSHQPANAELSNLAQYSNLFAFTTDTALTFVGIKIRFVTSRLQYKETVILDRKSKLHCERRLKLTS
jgi:hypothetical protein